LQEQYETRLSLDGFDSAVEVLKQKGKATVFITLSSDARDRWLQKNANTKLNNKELIYHIICCTGPWSCILFHVLAI